MPAHIGLAAYAFKYLRQALVDGVKRDDATNLRVHVYIDGSVACHVEQQVPDRYILRHHRIQLGLGSGRRGWHQWHRADDRGNGADRTAGGRFVQVWAVAVSGWTEVCAASPKQHAE